MAFDLKAYLLSKPEAGEDFPFGPEVAVYKVRGKMFATLGIEKHQQRMNLKCDPLEAEQLRMVFRDKVLPGYHMNKKHWNTIVVDGTVPDGEVQRMIDNSYALVVKSLGKAVASLLISQARDVTP